MNRLSPCPDCRRHIAVHERECPFCGAEVALGSSVIRPLPRERLSRSAALAFGASLAGVLSTAACDAEDSGEPPSQGGYVNAAGVYGAPAWQGGTGSGGTNSGGTRPNPDGGFPNVRGGAPSGGVGGTPSTVAGGPNGGIGGDSFPGTAGIYGGSPPDAGAPNGGAGAPNGGAGAPSGGVGGDASAGNGGVSTTGGTRK